MVKVISGLKNADLEQALAGDLCVMPLKTRKEYRNAVREAVKKADIRPSRRYPSVYDCQLRSQQQSHGKFGRSTELVIRAGLASGLAGTLYEYTSIPREPGGQAQEESAG